MNTLAIYDLITATAGTVRGLSVLLAAGAADIDIMSADALDLLSTIAATAADNLDQLADDAIEADTLAASTGRTYEIECHSIEADEVDITTYTGHLEGAISQARYSLRADPTAYAVVYDSTGAVILRISAARATAELGDDLGHEDLTNKEKKISNG